jgi:hypothetical protein
MATDRELIVLAKTKRLDAIVAHFQRSPRSILKKAMKLGLRSKSGMPGARPLPRPVAMFDEYSKREVLVIIGALIVAGGPTAWLGAAHAATYAAKPCRTAADSISSAAGVNRVPMTSPIRLNVRRATWSQNSVETPSANIAMTRCSSELRSAQEMPSIVHLGS